MAIDIISVMYQRWEKRANLVAKDDGVRLRFVFSNKNFTTSSASVAVRSAQTFSFGARKFVSA
jgi:hypothetical protein